MRVPIVKCQHYMSAVAQGLLPHVRSVATVSRLARPCTLTLLVMLM